MNVQALPSRRHSSTVAVVIYIVVHRVFVLVSIVNAICIISCLCLLHSHPGGYIRSSYMWIWGVTSGCSNYVYVCVIVCMYVCMYGLLCRCVKQSVGMLLYGQSSGE